MSPGHTAVLTIALTALPHLFSLGGDFHYDDGHSLVRNPHVRDLGTVARAFWDPSLFGENPVDRMYRPLVFAANAMTYAVFGLSPTVYIATNLLIHCVNAYLVTRIAMLLGASASIGLLSG